MECKLKKVSEICHCLPWHIPRNPEDESNLPLCGRGGNQCFQKQLNRYRKEANDCEHCKDDCEMIHFFTTLSREEFTKNHIERDTMFNPEDSSSPLYNYLVDPKRIFNDGLTLNVSKLTHNVTTDIERAAERFRRDIGVLNFFWDTQLVTAIQQEVKTSLWDKMSSVGGILGIFTGISFITLLESAYRVLCSFYFNRAKLTKAKNKIKESLTRNDR